MSVWIAWRVEQARQQRLAVDEFRKLHVAVLYKDPKPGLSERRESDWYERLFGAAYREPVEYLGFQHSRQLMLEPQRARKALALLARIRGLRRLSLEGLPIGDSDLAWVKPLSGLRELNLRYTEVTNAGVAGLRQAIPNCSVIR
ncbi:MAG TPA: hypothetical protein VG125_29715 [Pirellulales bacterium]|nr:hypothetical protein [Pirellulales bacterium]